MPALPHHRPLSLGSGPRWDSRRVLLRPGAPRGFHAAEWQRALVIVERGVLELEWQDGACLRFGSGDTLCLQGLGLTALRAVGIRPALLLVLRR